MLLTNKCIACDTKRGVRTFAFAEPLLLLLSLEAPAAGASSDTDDLLLSLSLPSDEARTALFLSASFRSRSPLLSSPDLARSLADSFSDRPLCLPDRLASTSLDDSRSEGSFFVDDLPWSALLSLPPRTSSSRSFLDESVFLRLHERKIEGQTV